MKKISVFFALFLTFCFASGPSQMAVSNRALWICPIDTPKAFDFASKMEILMFALGLDQVAKYTPAQMLEYTHLKKVNMKSIQTFIQQTKNITLRNFQKATLRSDKDYLPDSKPNDWEGLLNLARYAQENIPQDLKPWQKNAQEFYQKYLYEQMRLAGLFPSITSEILTFDKIENKGDTMPDKTFLLTFDDGPTKVNGNTDKTIRVLKELKVGAIFFILSSNQPRRKDIRSTYKGFLLGSHGEIHKPHTQEDIWKKALIHSKELSQYNGDKHCYFRPPYGQRTTDFVQALKNEKCEMVLWNIDSQDWSSKMSAPQVLDRVITLSLLWRSGIVLFHDIHPKAYAILSQYVEILRKSGANLSSLEG